MKKTALLLKYLLFIGGPYLNGLGASHANSIITITTCEQLQSIGHSEFFPLYGYYILTNDIDCISVYDFDPIGGGENGMFSGVLDGAGFEIHNYNSSRNGLFAETLGAQIKNIGISGVVNNPHSGNIGLLAGKSNATIISNSYATGNVTWGSNSRVVGGMVGYLNYGSELRNSYSKVNVSGEKAVGGLVGTLFDNSKIVNSYSNSVVVGGTHEIGGLVGLVGEYRGNKSEVIGSYSTGTVTVSYPQFSYLHSADTGGLVGKLKGKSRIANSYAISDVNSLISSIKGVGGLVGHVDEESIVTNSYRYEHQVCDGCDNILGLEVKRSDMYSSLWYREVLRFSDINWIIDSAVNRSHHPYLTNFKGYSPLLP
ncbi:hypothetical protein [Vibrio maritimus]|uniref:hypothetical protein n=1 Tax=Vibrio maritimus TaxID=990268 RepID=UPI001F4439C1|nr:hypothetical protein [Vibrio maritimus]